MPTPPPKKKNGHPITVALVEDNRLLREGLARVLNEAPNLKLVDASADTARIATVRPQVVLMDLGLRSEDSLAAVRRLKVDVPDTHVIMLDLLPVHEEIVEYVHAGVAGFVMKDAALDDLLATIYAVALGHRVVPPQMMGGLLSQITKHVSQRSTLADALQHLKLTAREDQVMALIAKGKSNREISLDIKITVHTVKSHVRNIMEKLHLHTRLQLYAYSHRAKPDAKESVP